VEPEARAGLSAVILARRLCGGVAGWPKFFGEEMIVARIKI